MYALNSAYLLIHRTF